jgi:hypothetical protein
MANQTLISVPPNVEEPVVLRRFLSRLLEQLDVVLGNRGAETNEQYVSQQDLLASAATLTESLEVASTTLANLIDTLGDLSETEVLDLIERIVAVEEKNVEQDGRLDGMDILNTTQDGRLDGMDILNTTQDGRLDGMDILNTTQDGRLTTLETAGYLTDAPSDGNTYGRKDGAWVIIP